jgi:hypothetical protein
LELVAAGIIAAGINGCATSATDKIEIKTEPARASAHRGETDLTRVTLFVAEWRASDIQLSPF